MKQTTNDNDNLAYILMELNSVGDEPGASLWGHAIAYSECEANEDGDEITLPSGVVRNYDELKRAHERSFELDCMYDIKNSPIPTMHVCFLKKWIDARDDLKPFVCAYAQGQI